MRFVIVYICNTNLIDTTEVWRVSLFVKTILLIFVIQISLILAKYGEFLCLWKLYCFYKYKQYSFHKHRNSPYLTSINEVCITNINNIGENYIVYICNTNLIDTTEVWRVSLFVKTILFIFVIQTSLILASITNINNIVFTNRETLHT
jgi:hypothetical protein